MRWKRLQPRLNIWLRIAAKLKLRPETVMIGWRASAHLWPGTALPFSTPSAPPKLLLFKLAQKYRKADATAQRLAISRARLAGTGLTEATALDMPPSSKMGQTEGVGCMAVLERTQLAMA